MSSIFPGNLTPHRRFFVSKFVDAVRKRTLTTADVQLIFIHFRETTKGFEFQEWGSSVAHAKRNQGWIWRSAIEIWSTHVYYTNLDRTNFRIDLLPSDIFHTVRNYLEDTYESNLIYLFDAPRSELIATLDHLYSAPNEKKRGDEKSAFYQLSSKRGVTKEDEAMIRRIILSVEDYALNIPPRPLAEIVTALEEGLRSQVDVSKPFSESDRRYLQLHCLVAFHSTLIDIKTQAIKELTGFEMKGKQPLVFVSGYEEVITLDLGFFEMDNGYPEPTSLCSPHRNLASGKLERFYYPLVASDLKTSTYLAEPSVDIRLTLYNHPIRVASRGRKNVIIAEQRELTRYRNQL